MLLAALVATIALGASTGQALAAPPANDNFSNATLLTGSRGTVDVDLTEATHEIGEPVVGSATDRTMWFRYTPAQTGTASFSTCRSETDLAMDGGSIAIYTGAALSTLSAGPSATGGCLNGRVNATVTGLNVTAGQTYWVQLAVSDTSPITGGAMAYDFNIAAPTNDDFADAATITGSLPQTLDADNGLATIEDTEPGLEDWGPRNSLWWKWTPDHDGLISIDDCSASLSVETDSRLDIYSDSDPDPDVTTPTLVEGSDDGCAAPNGLLSRLSTPVTSGETYFIRLANFTNNFGAAYELNLHWITEPELPAAPTVAPNNSRLQVGHNAYGSSVDWLADPAIDSTEYAWKRCDSSGNNCATISGETNSIYAIQPGDLGHRLIFTTIAHRGASDYSEDSAPSELVDDVPANDNFADAIDLGSTAPVSTADDNYFATLEDTENDDAPQPLDQSVWYRWTAPESKTYFVDGCQSADPGQFAVNVFADGGSGLATLAGVNTFNGGCPNGGEYSRTVFAANASSTYFIQAGSLAGSGAMPFTLAIHEVPAPSFDSAPTLSGDAIEQSTLSVAYTPKSSAISTTESVVWSLCDSTGSGCGDHVEIVGNDALITSAMVGKRLKATVTLTNANGSSNASALSGVIAALPVVTPPPGGGNTTPPVDPFPQPTNVPKNLGKVKVSKKKTIALSKLKLVCGATATGPCRGKITLTTAKTGPPKATIKVIKILFDASSRPGAAMPTTYKVSAKLAKAVKKAKKLKATLVIEYGAPGFSVKTIKTALTLVK